MSRSKPLALFAAEIVILLFASPLRAEDEMMRCIEHHSFSRTIKGTRISVSPATNETDADCKVIVRSKNGVQKITSDWGVTILPESGQDLNGDGKPDLVVEGYSGGAHCCWTYTFVSLEPQPRQILSIYNERPIALHRIKKGSWIIETLAGEFDYLRTSHAKSFFPNVYLKITGNKLVDISCQFRAEFDKDIAGAEVELKKLDPQGKSARTPVNELDEQIKYDLLAMIGSYLYSGRPEEAWKILNTKWPADDRAKLRSDILRFKRQGVLRSAIKGPCDGANRGH